REQERQRREVEDRNVLWIVGMPDCDHSSVDDVGDADRRVASMWWKTACEDRGLQRLAGWCRNVVNRCGRNLGSAAQCRKAGWRGLRGGDGASRWRHRAG